MTTPDPKAKAQEMTALDCLLDGCCYPDELCEFCQCIVGGFEKGFKAGRESMRKELLGDGEPDGWCAYRSKDGWALRSFRPSREQSIAMMVNEHLVGGLSEWAVDNVKKFSDAQERMETAGWQIVPVKLVKVEVEK